MAWNTVEHGGKRAEIGGRGQDAEHWYGSVKVLHAKASELQATGDLEEAMAYYERPSRGMRHRIQARFTSVTTIICLDSSLIEARFPSIPHANAIKFKAQKV